ARRSGGSGAPRSISPSAPPAWPAPSMRATIWPWASSSPSPPSSPSGAEMILHAVALALVVLGASLAIAFPDWRTVPVALAAPYLGIARLLATAASLVAGLVTLAVGLGVVAVVADWGSGVGGRETSGTDPRPLRAFDVAVLSLVVIGAIGLAASRPLL